MKKLLIAILFVLVTVSGFCAGTTKETSDKTVSIGAYDGTGPNATNTAKLTVSDSRFVDYPIAQIINHYAGVDYLQGLHLMAPNIGSHTFTGLAIGAGFFVKSAGFLGFNYAGGYNSDANYLTFFGHSVGNIMAITMGGKVGIATTTPICSLAVNGFSQFGELAPVLKCKVIPITTGATTGSVVTTAHGLTYSKILSATCLVDTGTARIPANCSTDPYLEYMLVVDTTTVNLTNGAGSNGQIHSKSAYVTLWYTE